MSEIRNIKCENKRNPLSVDVKQPRFSWQIVSEGKNLFQESYRIVVKRGNVLCWDSSMVEDRRTFGILYAGEELISRTSYCYTVEVVLSSGEHVQSEENRFETVLFDYKEWKAQFIEPDMLPDIDCDPLQECKDKWAEFVQKYMSGEEVTEVFDPGAYLLTRPCHPYHPAVLMCRKFMLPDHAKKARVYMTAHGIYEFCINGELASDVVLAPEFTTYDKILKYQVYDVTDLLKTGENVILVTIADGWYKGKIAYGCGCEYGNNLGLLLEMDVTCSDGSKHTVISDEDWLFCYDGPIRRADLFNGQTVDGRYEIPHFATSGMDISAWKPVHVEEHDKSVLAAQTDAPIRVLDELEAVDVSVNAKGETIVDFGQGFSGHIRVLGIDGEAGEEIIFEHTEQLDKDGNFIYPFTDFVQKQEDIYILNGNKNEQFEPKMTYHGFRYVRVTSKAKFSWKKEQFKGIVIGTDNGKAGDFSCSDERINRLQKNIVWSQRSNMVGIPTDCPTREKAGWTGDVYVYGKTSCFNQDMLAFYEEWLKSVRAEQMENGGVQYTVLCPVMVCGSHFVEMNTKCKHLNEKHRQKTAYRSQRKESLRMFKMDEYRTSREKYIEMRRGRD